MHLRHTTQTVSVLHAWIVVEMGCANLTILQQLSQVCRNCELSRMRTRSMNAFVESDRRPLQRFQRHRACHIRKSNKFLRASKRERSNGAHRLRAIEKSEAFLHFQLQRRNARMLESFARCESFAAVKNFSFADRCERKMRKRRQITTRAHAALFRNDRRHSFFKHRDERVDY